MPLTTPEQTTVDEKRNHETPPIAAAEQVSPPVEDEDEDEAADLELSHSTSSDSHSPHHGSLESVQTARDDPPSDTPVVRTTTTVSTVGPVHSVFSKNQKRFIVAMASWAGFFSPVSSNIYFPALNSLSRDLHVSGSLINLTLTSYMIFQGLAPSVIGDLADLAGRRPAYLICFTIYIGANIGLALQNSYAALFVLRCLQSSGSSATIALSSGIIADVATAAERGKYVGFATAGSLLGPAIGPVVGGVLAQFLGWRAIFWFLVILASAFIVIFFIFFPETARSAVGNGSIPPKGWNMSLMNYLAVRKARNDPEVDLAPVQSQVEAMPERKRRFPNPLASVHIIADKENALLLGFNALLFAAFYDITATIPSLYAEIYGFNDLQIGLCYIPFGVGSCIAALSNGQLLDRNFRRWAKLVNMPIKKGRQSDLRAFPIEKARLQLAIPCVYISASLLLIYGWVMDANGPLAVLLALLFFACFTMSIAFNVCSTLLIDFYPNTPATATAANNLCRCLLGAAATAVITPMINRMGRGWAFTLLSLMLFATSPMLLLVYFKGMGWREERRLREIRAEQKKEAKMAGLAEEAGREKESALPVEGGAVEVVGVAEHAREQEDVITTRTGDAAGPRMHHFGRTKSRDSCW